MTGKELRKGFRWPWRTATGRTVAAQLGSALFGLSRASIAVGLITAGLITAGLIAGSRTDPAAAAEPGLVIELNKVEDLDGGCVGSLLLTNQLGVALDRFNLDLFLFDASEVIVRRIMIDMAPLRSGKTRVAMFHLIDGACSGLSRVLVNDIPTCRAESGGELDCLAGLSVSSRSAVELVK